MSRAAKGYEKYGKQGMEALAKAGRDGKDLDPVRDKYNKYDESVAEGSTGDYSAKKARAGKDIGKPGKNFEKIAKSAAERYGSKERGEKVAGAVLNKLRHPKEDVEEGTHTQHAMDLNPDMGRPPKQGILGKIGSGIKKAVDVLAPGDEELLRRLEKSSGGSRPPMAKEAMSPARQKSFAALAPPTDKITFADKIAGAKKEVDEMLGDVAAEAMKKAIGGGRGRNSEMNETQGATTYTVAYKDPSKPGKSYSTQVKATSAAEAKAAFQEWDTTSRFTYLGSRPDVDTVHEASTDNAFDYKNRREPEAQKSASRIHKGTYGTEYDGNRDDAKAIAAKKKAAAAAGQGSRGRGRPKKNADSDTGQVMKPDFSAFGVGGKVNLPKHKGAVTRHKMSDKEPGKKVKEGSDHGQAQQIYNDLADIRAVAKQAQRGGEFPQGFASRLESVLYAAMTLIKNQQSGDAQVSEEELDEKAVSKKQQKFMGMVHAAQKGEKPASGAVAKVAKEMPKKAAKDFAATKHKGLPEKAEESDSPTDSSKKVSKRSAKSEEKVDETTVSGSVATAPAAGGKKSSGGFTFGGGIYDSMNRNLENMISESMSRLDESMSMNMSLNADAQDGQGKSLTITATGDDADKLAMMLKMAGMGSDHDHDQAYSQAPDMVDENKPDYPTNTETSNDAFQYSGGLNKPKSTGQTTIPVIASQEERQYTNEGQGPSDAERLDHYHDLKAGGMDPDEAEEEAYGTDDWYNDMNEQDPIARMMEMAGVKKKKPDFLDVDKDGDKKELFKKAVSDKEKQVDESIFAMTANLWKSYKGQ
jgi:hypothetical protein